MLVLTRMKGEVICIGPDIKVTVLRTGKHTRLGIDAPHELRISRDSPYADPGRTAAMEPTPSQTGHVAK